MVCYNAIHPHTDCGFYLDLGIHGPDIELLTGLTGKLNIFRSQSGKANADAVQGRIRPKLQSDFFYNTDGFYFRCHVFAAVQKRCVHGADQTFIFHIHIPDLRNGLLQKEVSGFISL